MRFKKKNKPNHLPGHIRDIPTHTHIFYNVDMVSYSVELLSSVQNQSIYWLCIHIALCSSFIKFIKFLISYQSNTLL